MSKKKRLLSLLLCLAMSSAASSAFAAAKVSKTFTTAPTVKATFPTKGVDSYDTENYTVTPSQPGFMTIRLLDEGGFEIAVLMENHEVHTKANTFEFVAKNPDGEPLPAGTYKLAIDMVNQFGIASKSLEKSFKVTAMGSTELIAFASDHKMDITVLTEESFDALLAAVEAGADPLTSVSSALSSGTFSLPVSGDSLADTSGAISGTSPSVIAPSSAAQVVAPPANEVTYAAGASVTGDEGLLIGVGVSDIATQAAAGFWGLTASASDEEIWAALTREMVGVDVAENESAYIYDSPYQGRNKLGSVSGISQGLNVILKRDDGWSLVETFRNEDGAFVRGYIKTATLRPVTPNQTYGIVVDKASQTLTVFKSGARLGSCKVSTGMPTPKYLHRETPAGEFITVTRRGSYDYYGLGFSACTIRINGNYYLCEVPTTKKNGTKFLDIAGQLGNKASRGNIVIAHDASTDGGINADWIWDMTTENKKVKVLVFDDKARTDVPVSSK
ncbi:MAG: L,D-transpeptidase [Clostridia bacterium]|nr:L,D-transpeptidase [Clostridia bacterium]